MFYRNTTIPVYILYKNNVKIGGTGYYKDDILPIKTTEFNINLVLINSKKNYIIKLVEDDSVIAEITKSRLRYGKKIFIILYVIIGVMIKNYCYY